MGKRGGGGSGGKNRGSINRRKRYNFIADVVQEVGSALVYIEIKDRGRVDAFTGMPQVGQCNYRCVKKV